MCIRKLKDVPIGQSRMLYVGSYKKIKTLRIDKKYYKRAWYNIWQYNDNWRNKKQVAEILYFTWAERGVCSLVAKQSVKFKHTFRASLTFTSFFSFSSYTQLYDIKY